LQNSNSRVPLAPAFRPTSSIFGTTNIATLWCAMTVLCSKFLFPSFFELTGSDRIYSVMHSSVGQL
jgi:hypothetical protein